MEPIVTKQLKGLTADNNEVEIYFALYAPIQLKDCWACRTVMTGPYEFDREIHGTDSFQALILGLSLTKNMLKFFEEDGGKLFDFDPPEEIIGTSLYASIT